MRIYKFEHKFYRGCVRMVYAKSEEDAIIKSGLNFTEWRLC